MGYGILFKMSYQQLCLLYHKKGGIQKGAYSHPANIYVNRDIVSFTNIFIVSEHLTSSLHTPKFVGE